MPRRPSSDRSPPAGTIRRRRGVGALALLVLGVATVLSGYVLSTSRSRAHLADQTGRLVHGLRADGLAQSVVDEIRLILASRVNAPADALGRVFRDGTATGPRDLTGLITLEHAPRLLEGGTYRGFEILSHGVEMLGREPLADSTHEARGLLRVHARVRRRERGAAPLTRRLEVTLPYRVVLVTPPQPHDAFGFYLGDAAGALGLERANAWRARILDEQAAIRHEVSTRARTSSGPGTDDFGDLTHRLLDRPELEQRLPPFPAGRNCQVVGLWVGGQQLTPGQLDLGRALADRMARRGRIHRELIGALAGARVDGGDGGGRGGSQGGERHRRLLETFERFIETTDSVLLDMWSFQNGLRVLEPGEPAARELERWRSRLRFPWFEERACYRIDPDPVTGDLQGPLDAFLERFPAASGVLVVRGPAPPITIAGPVGGRLVAAFHRVDVRARDLVPGRAGGHLTLGVFGGTLDVDGPIRAALIVAPATVPPDETAPDPTLRMGAGTRVEGALLIDRLTPESVLDGLIVRDTRTCSRDDPREPEGPIRPDRSWVSIGLEPVSRMWEN